MYKIFSRINLSDSDAAGILYFSNIFVKAHEAYESLLSDRGININDAIGNHDFIIPIVHAEADYKNPLLPGDEIEIQVTCDKIGESSYTLKYDFYNMKDKNLSAVVKTVHATIDKNSRIKIPIPEGLRSLIAQI
ncbi:acyl-CoA thioesterase [candidate division KSB1 bacterium]